MIIVYPFRFLSGKPLIDLNLAPKFRFQNDEAHSTALLQNVIEQKKLTGAVIHQVRRRTQVKVCVVWGCINVTKTSWKPLIICSIK